MVQVRAHSCGAASAAQHEAEDVHSSPNEAFSAEGAHRLLLAPESEGSSPPSVGVQASSSTAARFIVERPRLTASLRPVRALC